MIRMEIDRTRFDRAFADLLGRVKTSAPVLARQQVKGVVRNLIDITPPSGGAVGSSATGKQAEKAGRRAIDKDLGRIFRVVPVSRGRGRGRGLVETPLGSSEIARWHAEHRGSGGRTAELPEASRAPVLARDLRAYRILLYARIGWLAAGWNSAASRLGVPVAKWISRHGSSAGSFESRVSPGRVELSVANRVGFAADVRGLRRRVQAAVDYQANGMLRQVAHLARRAAAETASRHPGVAAK
jgi:hypothetical protein